MKFLNKIFNNNNTMKSDDSSTVCSEQSVTSPYRVTESYPDWNKAVTIRYGEPAFEVTRDKSRYHQNQGYFSEKTQVAEDRMYQR